jgi:hypothetical protein
MCWCNYLKHFVSRDHGLRLRARSVATLEFGPYCDAQTAQLKSDLSFQAEDHAAQVARLRGEIKQAQAEAGKWESQLRYVRDEAREAGGRSRRWARQQLGRHAQHCLRERQPSTE